MDLFGRLVHIPHNYWVASPRCSLSYILAVVQILISNIRNPSSKGKSSKTNLLIAMESPKASSARKEGVLQDLDL